VIGEFVPSFLDDSTEAIGAHLAPCDLAEESALVFGADCNEIDGSG